MYVCVCACFVCVRLCSRVFVIVRFCLCMFMYGCRFVYNCAFVCMIACNCVCVRMHAYVNDCVCLRMLGSG